MWTVSLDEGMTFRMDWMTCQVSERSEGMTTRPSGGGDIVELNGRGDQQGRASGRER